MSPTSNSSKPPRSHLRQVDKTTTGSAASPLGPPSRNHSAPSPSAAAGNGGQSQACAACKYQRRKCNPECRLARFFPADQKRLFLHAHRLFGVSNIQKTLRRTDAEYEQEAMRALIFEAEARAGDPVYGCFGIIRKLQQQIAVGTAQLDALHQQIAMYRQAAAAGGFDQPANGTAVLAAPGPDNVSMSMDAYFGGGAEHVPVHQTGAEHVPVHQTGAEHVPVHQTGAEHVPVHQTGAGFVDVHDQQQQQHYNALEAIDDHQDYQKAAFNGFCYDGTARDELASGDGRAVQEYCYSDASLKAGVPAQLTSLEEQLENHFQNDEACFVDGIDVKPQDLPGTMMAEHYDGHGGVEQPMENKIAAEGVNYDADQMAGLLKYDADQMAGMLKYDADQMAEPAAPATMQRELEQLGFTSSSF